MRVAEFRIKTDEEVSNIQLRYVGFETLVSPVSHLPFAARSLLTRIPDHVPVHQIVVQ